MAKNRHHTYSGSALRALRDQRLEAVTDPADEAARHERSFLRSMATAKADFDWIVEHAAWVELGFGTFADWWDERVAPVAAGLGMRPTKEVARTVVEMVAAEQQQLPRDQRRTQRQIADMVGVGVATVNRQLNPGQLVPNGTSGDPLDLVPAAKAAVEAHLTKTAAADLVPAADGARPANAGTPAAVPAPGFDGDGAAVTPAAHTQRAGWGGTPGECGVECSCGVVFDGFNTIAEAEAIRAQHQTTDHLGTAGPGDEDGVPAPSDAQPLVGDVSNDADGDETEVQDEAPRQSSDTVELPQEQSATGVSVAAPAGDPQELGEQLDELDRPDPVAAIEALADVFDRIDSDVLGPLMTEDEMTRIGDALGRIAEVVNLLALWNERTQR
jgi:hypothetical protein